MHPLEVILNTIIDDNEVNLQTHAAIILIRNDDEGDLQEFNN